MEKSSYIKNWKQNYYVATVHLLSHVQLFVTPWTIALQSSLFFTISQSLLKYSCSLSRWCHQTISSSVIPFSSCLQSLPASRSFQISQFFKSSGQIIEASASVLPMNIQSWLTGLISKLFKALSRVFSNITVQKHQLCGALPSLQLNSHIHTWILENHSLHSTEVGW